MSYDTRQISTILKYLQVILVLSVIMYFGKTLFIPLFFGILIAIIMYPVCKWFERRGLNRTLAISACLLIVTSLILALFAILFWQLNVLIKNIPVILDRLTLVFQQLQEWMAKITGMNNGFRNNLGDTIAAVIEGIFSSALQNTANTVIIFFLVPIYTALFMYHRKIFVQYLKLVTAAKYQQQLDGIIQKVIHTYFNFVKGMAMVYLLVGMLNTIGLFALGVRHAFLFGMLCAVMTIIPYVGIFISALLPISVVWMDTGNIWYPIGVIAVFTFVQYLEANVIFPKLVGTHLNVSTLSILIAIIAGGILWGVAGMVLFIPFVAILKIVSDTIEEWRPLTCY